MVPINRLSWRQFFFIYIISFPTMRLSVDSPFFSHPYSANTLQTAANALATLSLSSSPPAPAQTRHSTSFIGGASAIPIPSRTTSDSNSKLAPLDDGSHFPTSLPNYEHDSGLTKGGKKRGTIFTCESCSKVSLLFVTYALYVEQIMTSS